MSEERRDDDRDDPERDAILKRRNRWIALALGGASLAATSCGPTACLDIAVDAGPEPDAGPEDAGDGADGG